MKLFAAVAAASLFALPLARADSLWLTGAKADAIVQPLISAGLDPLGTHDYFQAGVVGCSQMFDEVGNYFEGGKVGDYIGEDCLFYGATDDSDSDGRTERQLFIPKDDKSLSHSPELAASLAKNRAIREGLESFLQPALRTANVNGSDVVVARTVGIGGIACDGYNARKQRVCQVLLSPRYPALHH